MPSGIIILVIERAIEILITEDTGFWQVDHNLGNMIMVTYEKMINQVKETFETVQWQMFASVLDIKGTLWFIWT